MRWDNLKAHRHYQGNREQAELTKKKSWLTLGDAKERTPTKSVYKRQFRRGTP